MVAWSVPVKDDAGNVVAVLARTTHLDQLLADYDFSVSSADHRERSEGRGDAATANGGIHRVVALVDGRDWKFLNHEWMLTPAFRALSIEEREALVFPEPYRERLAPLVAQRKRPADPAPIGEYVDRFGEHDPEKYGGEWLAAFAPVGDTGWLTVIQERRGHALEPIDRMRRDLYRYGVIAALVACGLIGLLWYFVSRALTARGSTAA